MSKYIRVSEDDREYLTTYQEHCEEVAALQDDGYDFEGCILKQADTIEELCDSFVVIHKELNGSHTVHRYNWLGKSEHEAGNELFGAIWTDKGLIYVAKMNERGCLELL